MILRGVALFLLLMASAHAELPPRLQITYDVLRNGSAVAEIVGRLESDGNTYRLTESWKGRSFYALLGRAMRTSEGSLTPALVRPREFTDERSGRDTARAWFDWGANAMTLRYKGKSRTEPIPPNAQDRLSFILALSAAPADAKHGDYHLVDGRGVSHHIYEFAGRERVQTPAGEFDARKIVRGAKDDDQVQIWLAKPLGGLPVRMLVVEKGGTRWDQVATRVER
ncbi:MAG TPA: DUF3108 domain-containing protein [Burkholderiales bacterium]|jgi:hypothetical protein